MTTPPPHSPSPLAADHLTTLLQAWWRGERAALDDVAQTVYRELHRLAVLRLRGERSDHTLGATDLISEAYLRLAVGAPVELHDRAHFFAIASRTMRQILVDHARRRQADKRGGGARAVELDGVDVAVEPRWDLVELDDALARFAQLDAAKAHITELHYFLGMTQEEIARLCGVHVNTVARAIQLATAWLSTQLRDRA